MMKALYPTIAWLIEVQGPVGKQSGYLKSSTGCIDVHCSKSSQTPNLGSRLHIAFIDSESHTLSDLESEDSYYGNQTYYLQKPLVGFT